MQGIADEADRGLAPLIRFIRPLCCENDIVEAYREMLSWKVKEEVHRCSIEYP